MNRQELLEVLVIRAAPEEQQQLRQTLGAKSTPELVLLYSKTMAESEQEERDVELAKVHAEREAEKILFQLNMRELKEPQRKADQAAKEARVREVLHIVCREHNLSLCEANFRSLLAADLDSEYAATQAIRSNAITLAPATEAELQRYEQERVDEHNNALLQATPEQLRVAVRQESAARQQVVQQDQASRDLESAKQRDAYRGYKQLPPEIDKTAIKAAPADKLRQWMRMYGNYQITTRLRGEIGE